MNTSRGFISLTPILIVVGFVVLGVAVWYVSQSQPSITFNPKYVTSFQVTPVSGYAPLTITANVNPGASVFFGGISINFGDKSQEEVVCFPLGRRCTQIGHTYSLPGTYGITLEGVGEGSSIIVQ